MELNFTLWRIYCILIILKTYLLDTIYNTTYNEIMAQWEKLLAKILSLDKDMRFTELKKVLQSYGYRMTQPKRGSSHYTFWKDGCNPITIPKHERLFSAAKPRGWKTLPSLPTSKHRLLYAVSHFITKRRKISTFKIWKSFQMLILNEPIKIVYVRMVK